MSLKELLKLVFGTLVLEFSPALSEEWTVCIRSAPVNEFVDLPILFELSHKNLLGLGINLGIKNDFSLETLRGNGSTAELAIEDLLKKVSNKKVAYSASVGIPFIEIGTVTM